MSERELRRERLRNLLPTVALVATQAIVIRLLPRDNPWYEGLIVAIVTATVVFLVALDAIRESGLRRAALIAELDRASREVLATYSKPPVAVEQRLSMMATELNELREIARAESARSERIEQRVSADAVLMASTAADAHLHFWLASNGTNVSDVQMSRFVPLRIFVGDPVPGAATLDAVMAAFLALADALGLQLSEELPPASGSWWKTAWLRTKKWMKQPEVLDVADKARAALELAYLDKPQAEANQLQAAGAAQIISALAAISGPCAVQAGSLLVIKTDGIDGRQSVVARTLSPMELRRLEENRIMLGRPSELLPWLASSSPGGSNSTDIVRPEGEP